MQQLILLVFTLPIISAVLIQSNASRLGSRAASVSVGFAWMTFLAAAVTLYLALTGDAPREFVLLHDWGIIRFDPLSTMMAMVIASISLIVHLYSVRYMIEEPGYPRFFSLLDGMTATLLLMVAAGDLVTLLVAWHLVGILLYFLLGFDTRSRPAWRYAFWTWITYRFGDLPLLLAAVLLYQAFDSWSLGVIFEGIAAEPDVTTVFGMLPLVLFPGAGSELYRGLGSVVVGGLTVSTVFTLILVPALFSLVLDARQALARRLGARFTRVPGRYDAAEAGSGADRVVLLHEKGDPFVSAEQIVVSAGSQWGLFVLRDATIEEFSLGLNDYRPVFSLDGSPGSGMVMARELLQHFGSVQRIVGASEDELRRLKVRTNADTPHDARQAIGVVERHHVGPGPHPDLGQVQPNRADSVAAEVVRRPGAHRSRASSGASVQQPRNSVKWHSKGISPASILRRSFKCSP